MSLMGATGPAPREANVAARIAADAGSAQPSPATEPKAITSVRAEVVASTLIEASESTAASDQRPNVLSLLAASGVESPEVSGDTEAAIDFLQRRAAIHPIWHPQLSFKRINPATGKDAGALETISFPRDTNGNPNWAQMRRWIDDRQGRGNIYWTVNAARSMNKKPAKKDIIAVVSLHADLDPHPEEDQDTADKRLTKKLETFRHRASVIIKSGGGAWGIYDLAEPILIDGGPDEIKEAESYNISLARDLDADDCHNIDRAARLPGTINVPNVKKLSKGRRAKLAIVHSASHERHPIESFTNSPANGQKAPNGGKPEYEPVMRTVPELANLDRQWSGRIFDGDVEGRFKGDRSRLAFAVACELVRCGLDDAFIIRVLMTTACGAHVQESPGYRLPRTLRRAHEFSIDPDLEAMNSKHAVLPIGDKTRVVTWDDDYEFPGRKSIVRAQSFPDFSNLHSNKRKAITLAADDNKTTKKVPLGKWWLSHPMRRQYDGGQRFMPQHDAEIVGDTLNMFEGFAVEARKPDGGSGASGCELFLDHGFRVICSGNEEHWDYLLKREAWIARNRCRSEIAAAYRTEAEGSGKGFWCNQLGRLYGRHYMQINKPEHVLGKFNPHLETLLKLCADEAIFVGDPRHRNALFGLITEPTLTIEPKNVNLYAAPNYLNIDMTTNSLHFVPASRTARRFFIPTVSEDRVGDLEYFKRIEAQLKDGGYEALLYHFLHEVDLRDFDVRRVPQTAGLAEQVAYSRKGLDGLVERVCNEGCIPCPHHNWPGFSVSNGYEIRQGFDYFIDHHTDRELRDLGALRVKRQLRKDWGCLSGDDTKRRDSGIMVHGVRWPELAELRARFIKRHGPQEWLSPDETEWPTQAPVSQTDADVGKPTADLGLAALVDTVATREPD